jgi:hypothetical protein
MRLTLFLADSLLISLYSRSGKVRMIFSSAVASFARLLLNGGSQLLTCAWLSSISHTHEHPRRMISWRIMNRMISSGLVLQRRFLPAYLLMEFSRGRIAALSGRLSTTCGTA